jgi:hypothetical protein
MLSERYMGAGRTVTAIAFVIMDRRVNRGSDPKRLATGAWPATADESRGVGQTVITTVPLACPAPTWPTARGVSDSG